jgi:hypothetical protein
MRLGGLTPRTGIDQTQQHFPSAAGVCSNNEGTEMEGLHVSIEIGGVKLEIIGNYWPGEAASWDSPGESESVEIEQILTASGDDIGGLVAWNDELMEHIEACALAAFKDGHLWAKAEAIVHSREMNREAA